MSAPLSTRLRAAAPRLRALVLAWAPRTFARAFEPDARELGLLGEELVARALRRNGAEVLARRLRTPWGELDLLARDAHGFVCVEVKSARCVPFPRPRGVSLPFAPDGPELRVGVRGARRLARIAAGMARRHGRPARGEIWTCTLDARGRARLARFDPDPDVCGSDFLKRGRD